MTTLAFSNLEDKFDNEIKVDFDSADDALVFVSVLTAFSFDLGVFIGFRIVEEDEK